MARKKKLSAIEALALVTKNMDRVVTVSDMEEERYFQTLLASYNRATGIGGHPVRRMATIHGPNSTGKSVLAALLAESARLAGHIPVIFEAEWAAEKKWLNNLVQGDGVALKMPANLDELISDVQSVLVNLERAKADGLIEEWVGICFVIDTLTKLIPEEQYNTLITEGVKKSYPMQAQWISQWMKVIVPQAYRSNSSFIIVVQDRQNLGATMFQKKRKMTLGESILYDASIQIECSYTKAIKAAGEVVANQFFYKVEKNKSDGFTAQEGSFFTRTGNGPGGETGIDLFREAIEEAQFRKVLKMKKRKSVNYVVAEFDEEELFAVSGGMSDLRKQLVEQPELFEKFISKLNETAIRQKR